MNRRQFLRSSIVAAATGLEVAPIGLSATVVSAELTLDDLKEIRAELRKHAVPPFMIDGEPYILLDTKTGKPLHPDEWRIVEQKMIRFEQFLAELKAEHDIAGYDFVAITAWNAAIECAIASCEIIAKKCCDNDHPYGEGAAEDCADAIRGNLTKAPQ